MVVASAALDSIRICSNCYADGDDQWVVGYGGSGATCSRCGTFQEDVSVYLPDANEPRVYLDPGVRHVEFSTCLDLDRRIIWDANGYYRVLGIEPSATKREIREAYQAMEGHLSPFATYAVKQLLNDEIRAAYDSVALGDTFFDHYAAAYVRRQAANDIAMSNMVGSSDGTPVELDLEHLMQKPFQVVDTEGLSRQGGDRNGFVSHPPGRVSLWGYYRWQSKSTNTYRLAIWRGLIARALRERGVQQRIAVGFTNGMAPAVEARWVGYRLVVFLGDQLQPNEVIADEAASRVVSIIPTHEQGQKI